jgi:hypothetical protein
MKQTTWILGAILVVLVAAAVIVLRQPGEQSTSGESIATLIDYDSTAVDKLEILSPTNGHIVLEKEGDVWNITHPMRYRAAEYLALRAVGTGRSIKLKSLISTNPEKQDVFAVDSAGMLVRFYEKGIEKGGVRVGKATPSFTETYVRLEGSNDVHIADGMLGSVYDRKVKDWRDKGIYRAPREAITDVKLQYGDTTISIVLTDSLWTCDGTPIGEPTSFLAALSKFETEEFVDTTIARLPKLTAVIDVNGTTLRFYFDKQSNKYYVQTSQSPQWFSIPLWKAKQVLKRKADFPPQVSTPS